MIFDWISWMKYFVYSVELGPTSKIQVYPEVYFFYFKFFKFYLFLFWKFNFVVGSSTKVFV